VAFMRLEPEDIKYLSNPTFHNYHYVTELPKELAEVWLTHLVGSTVWQYDIDGVGTDIAMVWTSNNGVELGLYKSSGAQWYLIEKDRESCNVHRS